jgi:hypothetical protein
MTGAVMLCDGRKSMIARSCCHHPFGKLPTQHSIFCFQSVGVLRKLTVPFFESAQMKITLFSTAAARIS